MNYHPDPALIQKAMDLMERAYCTYLVKINMSQEDILKTECGTVACHAGLYALATTESKHWKLAWNVVDKDYVVHPHFYLSIDDDGTTVGYERGADLLATDLGFRDALELQIWANQNPDMWGYEDGYFMFSAEGNCAFGKKDDETLTSPDIISHWRSVADRIAGATA